MYIKALLSPAMWYLTCLFIDPCKNKTIQTSLKNIVLWAWGYFKLCLVACCYPFKAMFSGIHTNNESCKVYDNVDPAFLISCTFRFIHCMYMRVYFDYTSKYVYPLFGMCVEAIHDKLFCWCFATHDQQFSYILNFKYCQTIIYNVLAVSLIIQIAWSILCCHCNTIMS